MSQVLNPCIRMHWIRQHWDEAYVASAEQIIKTVVSPTPNLFTSVFC
jgi:hypothetical protein